MSCNSPKSVCQTKGIPIELTKVYRQSDKVFVNVLDHIRTNTAGAADLQLLNTLGVLERRCRHHKVHLGGTGIPQQLDDAGRCGAGLYCKTATVSVLNSFRKTNILYKFNLVDKVKQTVYI